MGKSKTHEEYVKEVEIKNPNLEVIDNYINYDTKINHRCKKHNVTWLISPKSALKGKGCKQCANEKRSQKKILSHEEYVENCKTRDPCHEIIGVYIDSKTPIVRRCTTCGYIDSVLPTQSYRGSKCTVCIGMVIGPAPEYKNSIWASQYREYFSQFLTEEQMKNNMPRSKKRIDVVCPNCGKIKNTCTDAIFSNGLPCMCGDGQKYPNKFVYHILSQLHVNLIQEYNPNWSQGKRYDEYLIDYNIIIENHGLQHYEESTMTTRSLSDEQNNDKLKYDLAISNDITDYIVLDCRKSQLDWIKNSIMQSKLPSILNFSENDIDWIAAQQYATQNLVKQAADLFNQGYGIQQIGELLYKSRVTISQWLKNAAELGWCDYIGKKPLPIYCIEMNQVFNSLSDGARATNTRASHIIDCREGKRFHAGRVPETNEPASWLSIENAITQGYINI